MTIVNKIDEFQKLIRDTIVGEFGDITWEDLAEKVQGSEDFIKIQKDFNKICFARNFKPVDSSFKRIETSHIKTEHNDLRRTLKELVKDF